MMKMATGDGSPFGRVPEQGPDWFLVATKACGGGTPDLGYFLEVYVFIGIFGIGLTSGGSPSHPRGRGARPPPSWTAWDSSGLLTILRGLLLVQNDLRQISAQLDSV